MCVVVVGGVGCAVREIEKFLTSDLKFGEY